MLKLTNRLLQWLPSIPKPLSGLFRHLNRSKNEEVRPPWSLLLQACCLWFYNSHPPWVNLAHMNFKAYKPSTRCNCANDANRRMVKGTPAPNRLSTWAYGAYDHRFGKWVVNSLNRSNCITPAFQVICQYKETVDYSKSHAPTTTRICFNTVIW